MAHHSTGVEVAADQDIAFVEVMVVLVEVVAAQSVLLLAVQDSTMAHQVAEV
jgi:hypothetical protein